MTRPEPSDMAWPPGWGAKTLQLAGTVRLTVAGLDTSVEITPTQLERVYFPLLAMLNRLASLQRRVVAGLVGIPGSGKSTFAAALAEVARRVLARDAFAVVGMDGWHFSNAVLDARTTVEPDGRTVSLRERKGGPDSFDVPAFMDAISRIRSAHTDIALPAYDRRLHEPVLDALGIPRSTRVLLVEGNYLFSDHPAWRPLRDLLCPRLFLEALPAVARERVIARHIRGGSSPEAAMARFERNDGLNTEHVLPTAAHADLLIRFEPEPGLVAGP